MSLGLKKRLFSPQSPVGGSVSVFPHHTHAPPTLPSVETTQVVSGAGVLIEKTTPRPSCSSHLPSASPWDVTHLLSSHCLLWSSGWVPSCGDPQASF